MELRHLTYFSKVAESLSLSKAAEVLHITQPSLSRQMKELERELNYQLFRRTSRGVELTSAGHGLYRHLDAVFSPVERIPEVVRVAAESKALIRVGVPQGLPQDWFSALLDSLERQLPNIAVSLHEVTTDEQRQLLQKREIDLALMHLHAPEASSVLVLEQEMGIAVPADSPLAGLPSVDFPELDGLKVMAHAVGEIASEETRLRTAAAAAGAQTNWVFRRFSEHSWLIAKTAKVDAVLVTRASADRHIPGWSWVPVGLLNEAGRRIDIKTWATWNEPVGSELQQVINLFRSTASASRNQ